MTPGEATMSILPTKERPSVFVSRERLAVLLDEGLQRHGRAAADRLDQIVRAGEDAGLVVDRHLADVLQGECLLALAPLHLLQPAVRGPGVDLARCGRPPRRPDL